MIRNAPIRRGRLGDTATDSQLGCLSWPACVIGGTLCPQPDSFGATLNPCCHFAAPPGPCPDNTPPTPNADGSYGVTGAITGAVTDAATSTVAAITGASSDVWYVLAFAAVALLLVFEELKRK